MIADLVEAVSAAARRARGAVVRGADAACVLPAGDARAARRAPARADGADGDARARPRQPARGAAARRGRVHVHDRRAGQPQRGGRAPARGAAGGAGLRRVLLFTSADGRLGLNTFETTAGKNGDERRFGAAGADSGTAAAEAEALEKIAIYEGKIDIGGEFAAAEAAQESADALGAHAAPRRRPRVELKMDDFLSRCPSSYVVSHGQTPWLLRRRSGSTRRWRAPTTWRSSSRGTAAARGPAAHRRARRGGGEPHRLGQRAPHARHPRDHPTRGAAPHDRASQPPRPRAATRPGRRRQRAQRRRRARHAPPRRRLTSRRRSPPR